MMKKNPSLFLHLPLKKYTKGKSVVDIFTMGALLTNLCRAIEKKGGFKIPGLLFNV